MPLTNIDLMGLFIYEPVTAITDFFITILCIWVALNLKKIRTSCKSVGMWMLFFILMGLSAFFGGNSHAFSSYLQGTPFKVVWLTMHLMSGLALYFAQTATMEGELKDSSKYKLLKVLWKVQLAVFFILTILFQNFITVKLNIAVGMIFILLINLKTFYNGEKANGFIAAGILVSFLTAAVHTTKISFSQWFNYNDISHVLIMISLYLMFTGVWTKTLAEYPRSYMRMRSLLPRRG